MNYQSLTELIIQYTNRNEPVFISAIPSLIQQAMNRIYSEAKTIGFQKTIGGDGTAMVTGRATIDKPVDYKATINLQFTKDNKVHTLLPRSYEFCISYWPDTVNKTDVPLFYSADLDVPQNDAANSQIYIAPTPDQNFPYKLMYLSYPPVFNAQNNENFLTDKYPNLLLYACMVEAIPFLKCDERAAMFKSLYQEALSSVNKDTNERYTDRGSIRGKD